LLEMALDAEGVRYTLISTPDQIKGALPLVHAGPTIIKLHGDYRDTRIKNTAGELESYEEDTDVLLDRVLDEYGLIVCGWSADYDIALRAAMERCKSRRFSTYWAAYGEPSETAQKVISCRGAQVLSTTGADDFFTELHEKVTSL